MHAHARTHAHTHKPHNSQVQKVLKDAEAHLLLTTQEHKSLIDTAKADVHSQWRTEVALS